MRAQTTAIGAASALVAGLLGVVAPGGPVGAQVTDGSTFVVTTTADEYDGACTVDHCSLRDAAFASNTAPLRYDRIELPAGTFEIADEPIAIDVAVEIVGAGRDQTILRPTPGPRIRHFEMVGANARETVVADLTLDGRSVDGIQRSGGVLLDATEVRFERVDFRSNRPDRFALPGDPGVPFGADGDDGQSGADGGAIEAVANSRVTVVDSTFEANETSRGGDGGDGNAGAPGGSPPVIGPPRTGGDGGDGGDGGRGGHGGAIFVDASSSLAVERSVFADNVAREGGDGGDAGSGGTGGRGRNFTTVPFANGGTGGTGGDGGDGGDGGASGDGGAIYVLGELDVVDSFFRGNSTTRRTAGGDGGGRGGGGAGGRGGPFADTGTQGGSGDEGDDGRGCDACSRGGAIRARGDLEVDSTSFVENAARYGGGIHASAPATIVNSTFSLNRAYLPNDRGLGGAVAADDAPVTLRHVTAVGNVGPSPFEAIWGQGSAVITVRNSVVVRNEAEGLEAPCPADADPVVSAGGNVVDLLPGCLSTVADTDVLVGQDEPELGVGELEEVTRLAWVHPLTETSAALDLVPVDDCPDRRDQLRRSRPQGEDCDAGAVETVVARAGYWMVEQVGRIYPFGDVDAFTDVSPTAGAEIVGFDTTPDGDGLVVLDATGVVHTRGTADHHGDLDSTTLDPGERASAISHAPAGSGYWIFTNRGRAVAFGPDARHHGDLFTLSGPDGTTPIGRLLNGPVIASVATPDGDGYYMIATDGGVFSFGTADFRGSMGGRFLAAPIVGIAPDPDDVGYWLVASDGGIFAFDADFSGSVPGELGPGVRLNQAVIGAIAYGDAYLMVASDGGIFNFSSQPFLGSLGSDPPPTPVIGVAAFTN